MKWTLKEKKWMMEHYSNMSNVAIAKKRKRTVQSIEYFARRFGLTKSEELMTTLHQKGAMKTNRKHKYHTSKRNHYGKAKKSQTKAKMASV